MGTRCIVSSGSSCACRYDFALPLLVLHAFEFSTASNLKNWLSICPRRQITVLDTHDGMGVDDITGLAEVDLLTNSRRWQSCLVFLSTAALLILNKFTDRARTNVWQVQMSTADF